MILKSAKSAIFPFKTSSESRCAPFHNNELF
eukprot:UN16363